MALWEDLTKSLGNSWTANVLLGAAVVVLAPLVVPAVLAGMRPVAKAVIKGGVIVFDRTSEMIAEAGEQMSDLVAEARAELAASAAAQAQSASPLYRNPHRTRCSQSARMTLISSIHPKTFSNTATCFCIPHIST
jgi:hypothetical protein